MDASRIQLVSCETGEPIAFPALAVGIESGDRWSGLRVQTMFGTGAGELDESYLPRHVLTVGSSRRLSASWVDGPTIDVHEESSPDTVYIFPAMQPYRASWDADAAIFVELSAGTGRRGHTVPRARGQDCPASRVGSRRPFHPTTCRSTGGPGCAQRARDAATGRVPWTDPRDARGAGACGPRGAGSEALWTAGAGQASTPQGIH